MSKILISVIVVVVLGVGLLFWKMHRQNAYQNTTTSNTQTMTPSSKPGSSPMVSSSSSASDKALDQKFQDVQGSLNKLDTDQKTANQDSSSQDTPGNY